jgi:hypothetical protein
VDNAANKIIRDVYIADEEAIIDLLCVMPDDCEVSITREDFVLWRADTK